MSSIIWNVKDVPVRERFAYWREAVCQTYLPLEPEDLTSGAFEGRIDGLAGRSFPVSRVRTSPTVVARTRLGINHRQDGSYFANLQMQGEALVEQYGQRSVARPGDIVLLDTNEPFSIRFEQPCDLICATLGGTQIRRHLRQQVGTPASVIRNTGAGRIAAGYMRAMQDMPADLIEVEDIAQSQLTALLVRSICHAGEAASPAQQQEPLLRKICDLIESDIDHPQLSVKYACRALGISRTTLFNCFAETGTTFAAYVRNKRLDRIKAEICNPRLADVPLGEIAQRAGFVHGSTFIRAFRKKFGVAPGTLRSAR